VKCIWLHLKPITLLICPCSRPWHAICTHKQHLYFPINYLPFTVYAHIHLLERSTMLGATYTRNSVIDYWAIPIHEWQPWRVTSFQSSCCQAKTGNMRHPNYWYDAQTYKKKNVASRSGVVSVPVQIGRTKQKSWISITLFSLVSSTEFVFRKECCSELLVAGYSHTILTVWQS